MVLISVCSSLFRLEFHFKALLIKLFNLWLNEKRVNLVFQASKGIQKSYGELALGKNCIKTISDKSNSLGMFLQIQSDMFVIFFSQLQSKSIREVFKYKCMFVQYS